MAFLPGLTTKSARDAKAVSHAVSGSSTSRGSSVSFTGDWDYEEAVAKALKKSVWVFRCIDAIASNQSFIPIYVRKGFERDHEILPDPRLYRLLNYKPNDYETAFQFRWRLSAQLLLSPKGAFIEIVKDTGGQIHSLHLIPPNRIDPIKDDRKFVSGFEVTSDDGYGKTTLPPEKIIWIKVKPDPTDPYLQMTPLMSLGITIENDMLARLFNMKFLEQDGRPGTLIGIKGELDADVAEEMQKKFSGGPLRAGDVFIIDGAEDIDVKDMSSTPRDIQWAEALLNNKGEILNGFGVPETVLGSSSGRTFNNADAEYEVFWVQTMKPHCEAIANGLDKLTSNLNDDVFLQYDYQQVDVLQRQERNRHAQIFDTWRTGGMSFNEYRKRTGQKEYDVPAARMVFLANGAVIAEPDDILDVASVPILGITPGEDTGEASARAELANYRQFESQRASQEEDDGAAAAVQKSTQDRLTAARAADNKSEKKTIVEDDLVHPYLLTRTELESSINGVLTSWGSRQKDVVLARLTHVKSREGTRHWEGGTETKALDGNYAVEISKWADDATKDLELMIRKTVEKEGIAAAQDLVRRLIVPNPDGHTFIEKVYGSKQAFDDIVEKIVQDTLQVVHSSVEGQSRRIVEKIQKEDEYGADMETIKAKVAELMDDRSSWRDGLAKSLTTQVVEGIKYIAYSNSNFKKRWMTQRDERVRHSHYEVDRKTKPLGEAFNVGGSLLQYPGDPSGAIEQIINCRCWLNYEKV